jgi:hypothetical protein
LYPSVVEGLSSSSGTEASCECDMAVRSQGRYECEAAEGVCSCGDPVGVSSSSSSEGGGVGGEVTVRVSVRRAMCQGRGNKARVVAAGGVLLLCCVGLCTRVQHFGCPFP